MSYGYEPTQQAYFSKLPKLIQESIIQSGVTFQSEAELRNFVAHLIN